MSVVQPLTNALFGGVAGSAINAAASIANAQNSYSDSSQNAWANSTENGYGDSWNQSSGSSWGQSTSNATGSSSAWSKMQSDAISNASSEEWSKVYGSEASAEDIKRAEEANQLQRQLWAEQAQYNAEQAQIDRDYQERMSNTAYQRAVIDLMKAGLNPILAVGNMGASTPVGAMASSGLATANKAQTFANSESYGHSASSSYSHSEASSKSKSKSKSKSQSTEGSKSSSSGGSHSENSANSKSGSKSKSESSTETQLKQMVDAVAGLVKGK